MQKGLLEGQTWPHFRNVVHQALLHVMGGRSTTHFRLLKVFEPICSCRRANSIKIVIIYEVRQVDKRVKFWSFEFV